MLPIHCMDDVILNQILHMRARVEVSYVNLLMSINMFLI